MKAREALAVTVPVVGAALTIALWPELLQAGRNITRQTKQSYARDVLAETDVTTGDGVTDYADAIQALERELVPLELKRDRLLGEIDAEYKARRAAGFDTPAVRTLVERECAGVWCFLNAYCGCDDDVLRRYRYDDNDRNKQSRLRHEVDPLTAEIEDINAQLRNLRLAR